MTWKKILKIIIRSNQQTLEQSPATEYKQQQQNKAEQANATARLTPPKDRAVFGVAVSFFVMVFVSQRNAAHLFFLKDREQK